MSNETPEQMYAELRAIALKNGMEERHATEHAALALVAYSLISDPKLDIEAPFLDLMPVVDLMYEQIVQIVDAAVRQRRAESRDSKTLQ